MVMDSEKESFDIITDFIKQSNSKFIIDGNTVRKLRNDVQKFSDNCIEEIDKFLLKKLYDDRFVKPVPYDPAALFQFYPCLKLKKGFHIDSHFTSNPGSRSSSRGYVYVIPDGYKLPIPESVELDEALWLYLSWGEAGSEVVNLPEWAHEDVASFLEGDGSPLSYFQSSIFVRDLYELGASWHGLQWGVNKVLVSYDQIPKDEKWTWHEPKPDNWLPLVWKDKNDDWNVSFYTHDDMKSEIIFHNDIYRKGYSFEVFCFTIASSYQAKMF